MKYFWDTVEEMIVKVEIVGRGELKGKPVLAIEFGPYLEWVDPKELHDEEDDDLKGRALRVAWVKKRDAARKKKSL